MKSIRSEEEEAEPPPAPPDNSARLSPSAPRIVIQIFPLAVRARVKEERKSRECVSVLRPREGGERRGEEERRFCSAPNRK